MRVIKASGMAQPDIKFINVGGERIATRFREGREPTLMFLPGYASDMEGAKSTALDAFAEARGQAMLRFDYSGTGSSGGEFAEGTFEKWVDQSLTALDRLTKGSVVVVGSSMGGWIALHLAIKRPLRIAAIVGIAAAPDFTQWGFTESQMRQIVREGMIEEDNPYGSEPGRFHRDFWESAQAMRLLEGEIAIDCPVRLVHGENDEEVPLEVANRLMCRLHSADVQLLVIKGGGHRLSEAHEIAAILSVTEALLEPSI
jgi:pimeloyl-ACP methyl ester carboxylesterase